MTMLDSCGFDQRLIIHVGSHKTGTTTIQAWLDQNADALKANGILYPEAGRSPYAPDQHWGFGNAIIEKDTSALNKITQSISNELEKADYHTILISTEVLSRKTALAENLALIASIFPYAQREWLLVMRRQDELLKSQYAEHLKQGYLAYPASYKKLITPQYLNHLVRIQQLVLATNNDPIRVARFSEMRKNLVPNFLNFANLDLSKEPEVAENTTTGAEKKNVSPAQWALALMRYPNRLPRPLAQMSRKAAMGLGDRFPHLLPLNLLPSDVSSEVMDRYYPSNKFIEQNLFSKNSRIWTSDNPGHDRTEQLLEDPELLKAVSERVTGWTN